MKTPQYLIKQYQCLDFLPLASLSGLPDGARPGIASWIPDLANLAQKKDLAPACAQVVLQTSALLSESPASRNRSLYLEPPRL